MVRLDRFGDLVDEIARLKRQVGARHRLVGLGLGRIAWVVRSVLERSFGRALARFALHIHAAAAAAPTPLASIGSVVLCRLGCAGTAFLRLLLVEQGLTVGNGNLVVIRMNFRES